MNPRILTLGHSNRPLEDFLALLKRHGVACLADVRTLPRSRFNPQFNQDRLAAALELAGIEYRHVPALGGLRRARPDSPHRGLEDDALRGFADHMDTPEFEAALAGVLELTATRSVAMMCAEAAPEHCHRSLIADALVARVVTVRHILDDAAPRDHTLTRFARVEGCRVSYPDAAPELPGLESGLRGRSGRQN